MPEEYKGNLLRDSRSVDAWLAMHQPEAALDADLPIVDAHHHLWDHHEKGIRYLFDELRADLHAGHRIVSTVFVEASSMYRASGPVALRPVGEVEFAAGMAAMADSGQYGATRVAEAIIAHADLRLGGAVREVLEAERDVSGGRLRGVRHYTVHDQGEVGRHIAKPSPSGLLGAQTFRQGVAELHRMGLSFDAWVFYTQLDEVASLAAAFPDMPFILDHAGTLLGVAEHARDAQAARAVWRRGMQTLAGIDNVFVKIGGMGMPMFGHDLHLLPEPPSSDVLARAWAPAVETCIELFGPRRCMFESNFPVDRQSCGYSELWNAFKRITRRYGADERLDMFGRTAAKVYRMTSP